MMEAKIKQIYESGQEGGKEACADARSRNQTETTHLQHQTALDTNNLTRHFQHDSQVDNSNAMCRNRYNNPELFNDCCFTRIQIQNML